MRGADGCLVFDAGPHGLGRAGHGHADALSVQLSLGEERVLVDPGTFQYGAPLPWRDAFRCAAAHNTILIDGVEPATTEGPFAWASRVDGRLDRRPTTDDRRPTTDDRRPTTGIEWVEGSHVAYRSLDDPVTLRRRVVFCRGEYWVIEEYALGCKEHVAELLFHLAMGASVEIDPSGDVRVLTGGGRVLWIVPLEEDGVAVEVVTGQCEPPLGWVSPRYGERVAAPVVRFRHRRVAPFRCRTLLLPVASGRSADEIRERVAEAREAWGAERSCAASVV